MVNRTQFDEFEAYYDESKQVIDQRITEIMGSEEDMTLKRRALEYSMRGGKRIRPVMTLLVSDVFDSPFDYAINHAVIVELIHGASLVADDAVDQDEMRRGAPALWKVLSKLPKGRSVHKFVTGATIMSENGLVALAFKLAAEYDVAEAAAHGMRQLVDGFFMEGANVFDGIVGGGYDKYIEINKAKTGGLFALSAWMPATYVDAPEEQVDAARKYGERTGILYQIADDIADGDLPAYVEDRDAELEKWYGQVVEAIERMPDGENDHLLYVAPAYMVARMFEQEDMLGEMDADFLPAEVPA